MIAEDACLKNVVEFAYGGSMQRGVQNECEAFLVDLDPPLSA